MSTWDDFCVQAVEAACGVSCGCAHSVCTVGAALTAGCSQCASTVCAFDSSCCDAALGWEPLCVGHAMNLCGVMCP
jgi:hypothetical protein